MSFKIKNLRSPLFGEQSVNKLLLSATLAILAMGFQACQEEKQAPTTTSQLFEAMKEANEGNWFQHFTFKQNTIFFDTTGARTDSAVWEEYVSYPYLFRIDRDLEKGNYTIYRGDSTYHILADTLYSATADAAAHLLYKGGLYFVSLEEALRKLSKYKYDIESFRKEEFMGEPAYVVGDSTKQFWLHAEHWYCLRRISKTPAGGTMEVVYGDHKNLGKGWVEQKVTFYYNGFKRMEEFYFDIELQDSISQELFEVGL